MARKPMTEAHKAKLVESMQKARLARLASGEKVTHLDPVERAKKKPTSLRLAVNGKCWDCQGGDADPLPRQRIGQCDASVRCPLWPVRPYQKHAKGPKIADLDETQLAEAAKAEGEVSGEDDEEDVADDEE